MTGNKNSPEQKPTEEKESFLNRIKNPKTNIKSKLNKGKKKPKTTSKNTNKKKVANQPYTRPKKGKNRDKDSAYGGISELTRAFFLIVGVLFLVYIGWSIGKAREINEYLSYNEYYDELLNFTLDMPEGWDATVPNSMETMEAVRDVTGGVLFDMVLHPLPKEVVPIAFMKSDPDPEVPFAKFMTLAFKGANPGYTYLDDKVKLKDEFESLLKGTEHTDVEVLSVEDYEDENLLGILVKGKAKLSDQELYYYQYYEPAGANILVATYGVTEEQEKESLKEMSVIIGSMVYLEGGEYLPEELKEEMRIEFEEEYRKAKEEMEHSHDHDHEH